MTDKINEVDRLKNTLKSWEEEKSAAEYFKKKLGVKAKGSNKILADQFLEKIFNSAMIEDKPEWSRVMLELVKVQDKNASQTNVQVNVGNWLDNIRKMEENK